MADKGKSDDSATDFEWNWYDGLPGVQTYKSMSQGAKDAADLWERFSGEDTDPDGAASTSDPGDSTSGDSDSGDSSDAAPDGDGGLAARTVEPMIPIPIDGGRGQLRIYEDPEGEDEPIGVRDSIVARDGETEVEYAVEVVRGQRAVDDLLSRYSPQPTSQGDADEGTDAESTGASVEGGGGDVWVRETTQNPLAGILDSDRFGAQVIKGLGPEQAEKGKVDNNVYVNKATGETVIGLENLPERAKVIDGTSVRTVEEGGQAGAETRTENPLGQGLLRMDRGDADKEIDWDGLKPPPAGERETPGLYDGDGEGQGPDPTDSGKDASLTGRWRDMTDYEPDDSPVNRQAWDMMGGAGRSSTPAGGGGQGSGTGSGDGPTGGRDGTGGTGGGGSGTGTGGSGTTVSPGQSDWGFDRIPGRTGSGGGGGGSGDGSGTTGEPGTNGGSGSDGGGDGDGTGTTGGSETSEDPVAIGWDYDNDGEVDEWTDTDGNPVPAPDPSTGDDGGDGSNDAAGEDGNTAGVGRSEDRTGEGRRPPSEEDLDEVVTFQGLIRGGLTPIDPSDHDDGLGSAEGAVRGPRPGVDQPGPFGPRGRGGGEVIGEGTLPGQDELIRPNPLDDDGVREPGEYLATPDQEVAEEQAAQEAAARFADSLQGGSGDETDDDGDEPESLPLQDTIQGEINLGDDEPAEPTQLMSYLAVSENDLNHAGLSSSGEDEEDATTEVERERMATETDFTPMVDDGLPSRTGEMDDDPLG